VVDPLAGFDVSGLGEVLADPRRTKVFHDGEYDVLILKRDYAFEFAGLFDTRVAAAALGEVNPGLASVLRKHFDVELDKSLQRSDWSRRPLEPGQIAYARLDTRYLIPLMDIFQAELERLDRTMVVDGECRRLEALEPAVREFNPDEFVKIKGVRDLAPLEQRCLRELFVLRDRLASQRDRPAFKIMSNQLLLELARTMPRTLRALSNASGFSPRMARRIGDDVLDAVHSALDQGPLKRLPTLPSKDGTGVLGDDAFELHERLRNWRKERAEQTGMDSSLVLNRKVMIDLARARPTGRDELTEVLGPGAWQLERFGDELLALCATFEDDLAAGRIPPPRSKRGRRESGRG
jgi:ribonuclease D